MSTAKTFQLKVSVGGESVNCEQSGRRRHSCNPMISVMLGRKSMKCREQPARRSPQLRVSNLSRTDELGCSILTQRMVPEDKCSGDEKVIRSDDEASSNRNPDDDDDDDPSAGWNAETLSRCSSTGFIAM
eukprot:1868964-Rhodomonas_salina.1